MNCKRFIYCTLAALLGACSAGRHDGPELTGDDLFNRIQSHGGADCVGERIYGKNTIFVNPGLLLLGIEWGGGRAVAAGQLLAREGFGSGILELRSRRSELVYERMMEDPGTRFLGIHYSMGGAPQTIDNALTAAQRASENRKQLLVYNPILVEPFGFRRLHETVDLDSPYLGRSFVLVSSGGSVFRPEIAAAPEHVLNHEKLHIVYPEDFGLR